jgi:hypothetical protein
VQQDAAVQYYAVPCFKHYRYAKINKIILLLYILMLKELENNESIVTDFINALPGNGSVNTLQHATTEQRGYATQF